MSERMQVQFIQIAVGNNELFGLDKNGVVWKYVPAKTGQYATWTSLTSHGLDNSK